MTDSALVVVKTEFVMPAIIAAAGTKAYGDCGFDQRVMVRAIAASRAYNLTSKLSHPSQGDIRRFQPFDRLF